MVLAAARCDALEPARQHLEALQQLAAMGFGAAQADEALRHAQGDVARALDRLAP